MEWSWVLVAALVLVCTGGTTSTRSNFKAAVFEHRHKHDLKTQTPRQIQLTNLGYYERAAQLAAEKGTDILVFNEYGLFDYKFSRDETRPFMERVPDPRKEKHNPCLEKEFFKNHVVLPVLSCMARKHEMYIVGNLGDIQPCDDSAVQVCDADKIKDCHSNVKKCPKDGVYMYNTNVVFDRAGNLVARYHKVHPYFEVVDVPDGPEFVTFDTSFGRFGLAICFDLLWKEVVILARDYGIDTLIYPVFWFDEMAPFHSVEYQQSWSLENKVNLLAANGHVPGTATLGSGIYSKDKGALVYTYEPDGQSKLLLSDMSGDSEPQIVVFNDDGHYVTQETGDTFPLHCDVREIGPTTDIYSDYRCFKSQSANSTLVKLEGRSGQVSACDNGFCCSLTYEADDMREDFYLAVRNYTNDVEEYYHWEEEACLLVRCDPLKDKKCVMLPSKSETVFRSLELRARFTAERIYATVTKDKYRLAPKSEWTYKTNSAGTVLSYKSESNVPFLKAGLFGRCFDRDPPFVNWYSD